MKESDVIDQVCSLIAAGKVIVPFAENKLLQCLPDSKEQVAFVDLSNYQVIEEYCPLDQTISVQCGMKIKDLQSFLNNNKQWLPVAECNQEASLLDLILTGDAGPLQTCFGGLRRHILGLTFILSDGQLVKSGGKVVKNVSGYDLTRFLIGSYGYFAIPIKAHLRLYALPEVNLTITTTSNNLTQLFAVCQNIFAAGISLAFMDLVEYRLFAASPFVLKADDNHVNGENANIKYVLAARIFGSKEAVESDTATIQKIFANNNLSANLLTKASDQEGLLKQLAGTGGDSHMASKEEAQKLHTVDLSLKNTDCLRLLQNRNFASFPFLYRAGSGRLRYYLASRAEQDFLLASLAKYARENSEPLTVAYSDNRYLRKVSNLNADTDSGEAPIELIKRKLKEQFDPDNVFNPFVDL